MQRVMKHFIKKESTQYFLKTEYKSHIIYTSVIERKTPAMCKVTEENFMKINATSSEKKCTCIIRQDYNNYLIQKNVTNMKNVL